MCQVTISTSWCCVCTMHGCKGLFVTIIIIIGHHHQHSCLSSRSRSRSLKPHVFLWGILYHHWCGHCEFLTRVCKILRRNWQATVLVSIQYICQMGVCQDMIMKVHEQFLWNVFKLYYRIKQVSYVMIQLFFLCQFFDTEKVLLIFFSRFMSFNWGTVQRHSTQHWPA